MRFPPKHAGDASASLRIDDNAANAPHSAALTGIGAGAAAPPTAGGGGSSPAGSNSTVAIVQQISLVQVAGTIARSLTLSSLTLPRRISVTQLRRHGLRIAMRLPDGTGVGRYAVYRSKSGKRTDRALAIGYAPRRGAARTGSCSAIGNSCASSRAATTSRRSVPAAAGATSARRRPAPSGVTR